MSEIEYIGKCLHVKEEGKKLLVIGDLHLGYEEVLNKAGVFVSRQMFKETIEALDNIFKKVGKVDYVVLLGDVKHDFGRILRQEWADVLKLIDYLREKAKETVIIKGNHDAIIDPLVREKGVRVVDLWIYGELCFLHGDREFEEIYQKKVKKWVVGHGHPAVTLCDGIKEEKYKCFLSGTYKGREVIIVPSFFDANEGSDPRRFNLGLAWDLPLKSFDVYVVGEGINVLKFGKLGKI